MDAREHPVRWTQKGGAARTDFPPYQNDADYNTAKNIRLRYLSGIQTNRDVSLGVRLNSRTLSLNSEYSATEVSAKTGVHAESPLP